jgi:Tfp pilus assembly protein PilF
MSTCHRKAQVLLAMVCFAGGFRSSAQSHNDFESAMAEFRAGHYAQAATMFAQVDEAVPGTTDALLYRAKSLVHLEDFAGADQALRAYLPSHRDPSDALYMLGFVLNRENRPADSLTIYTQAAAITRPTSDDLKIVGLDYVLLDDYADAIKWLEKAVALDIKNKDAWYYLGRAYYTRSRLNEARKAFQTVLDLDPANAKAENNLGLILESDAQPSAAIEAFQKAIAWQEHEPSASEQPYVNLGSLLIEQGRVKEAIEPLEKAVKLAPENAYCRLRLGTAYLRVGEFDEAQRELEKAIQIDPDDPTAHYQLGRLFKEIHAPERAKAEFERTEELQRRSAASPQGSQNH